MAAMRNTLSKLELAELNGTRMSAWTVSAAEDLIERCSAVHQQLAQKKVLSAWERACMLEVAEIIERTRAELLRREIAAVMQLAGQNYAVNERDFWRRYHAQTTAAGPSGAALTNET
jgi:hypothetical protein